jgi:hypothetical protein
VRFSLTYRFLPWTGLHSLAFRILPDHAREIDALCTVLLLALKHLLLPAALVDRHCALHAASL